MSWKVAGNMLLLQCPYLMTDGIYDMRGNDSRDRTTNLLNIMCKGVVRALDTFDVLFLQ